MRWGKAGHDSGVPEGKEWQTSQQILCQKSKNEFQQSRIRMPSGYPQYRFTQTVVYLYCWLEETYFPNVLHFPSMLKMRKVHAVYKSIKNEETDGARLPITRWQRIIAADFQALHLLQEPWLSKFCVSDAHIIAGLVKHVLLLWSILSEW